VPNGGGDNCGECQFRSCRIRDIRVPGPYWHYCANHQHHNPLGIEVPVGAVYTVADSSYRRVEVYPPPDGGDQRNKLLDLLEQLVAGELEGNGGEFHLTLIDHLSRLGEARSIPNLVTLACRPAGEATEVPRISRHTGRVTHRARVEAQRAAALRALRALTAAGNSQAVRAEIDRAIASADDETRAWARKAHDYILRSSPG